MNPDFPFANSCRVGSEVGGQLSEREPGRGSSLSESVAETDTELDPPSRRFLDRALDRAYFKTG